MMSALVTGLWTMAQNPYPTVPIDSIQYVSSSKLTATPPKDTPDYINPTFKYAYGDTVRFQGIVAFNPRAYALSTGASRVSTWLQRKGGGPWSGVQVMLDPSVTGGGYTKAQMLAETKFEDNISVGYPVRITARHGQFNGAGQSTGETQMYVIRNSSYSDNSVEQVSLTKDTLVYSTISIGELMTGTPVTGQVQQVATGEKWEGVLVTIPNVTIYSRTANGATRWNWSVIDASGNVLDIRDISAYYNNSDNEDSVVKIPNGFSPPIIGTKLSYIRGIITEAFAGGVNRYYIAPLYPDDIGVVTYKAPIVNSLTKSPALVTPNDSVTISTNITTGTYKVTGVKLYYATNYEATTFDSLAMLVSPVDQNVWYAKIPNKAAGTVVKYWIRATDSNNVSTDYPNNLGLNSAYRVVAGNNVTIQDLQFSVYGNYATMFNGDSLTGIDLRGIVTGNNYSSSSQNLLTIQNGTGPNSAILIQRGTGDPTNSWKIGDSVKITSAKVTETFTTTILYNIRGSVISSGNPLPPFQKGLPIDSFIQNKVLFSRPWEAVLVRFDSVSVTNVNPDAPSNNGEFSFHPNTSASVGLRVDDLNPDLRNLNGRIKNGMPINFIQGPMWFSFSNFKMIPRGLNDIDLSHLDSLAPKITILGNNPDTTYLDSVYTDKGATAIDNIDGDITSQIIKLGTVDTHTIGTYQIWYKATDAWGNSDSASRFVIVLAGIHGGFNENELNYAYVNLFPNPASDNLNISLDFVKSGKVTMNITDVLGKVCITKNYIGTKVNDQINTNALKAGVYFATFSNENGIRTVRFAVSK